MLKTSHFYANRLVLRPAMELDPATTVAQLFADGPVRLEIVQTEDGEAQVSVAAPGTITVQVERNSPSLNAHEGQGDLFEPMMRNFDLFLEQERVRIDLEAATVDELRESRSGQSETDRDGSDS
jgi:hypothetical protein